MTCLLHLTASNKHSAALTMHLTAQSMRAEDTPQGCDHALDASMRKVSEKEMLALQGPFKASSPHEKAVWRGLTWRLNLRDSGADSSGRQWGLGPGQLAQPVHLLPPVLLQHMTKLVDHVSAECMLPLKIAIASSILDELHMHHNDSSTRFAFQGRPCHSHNPLHKTGVKKATRHCH